jgi:RHS repeat-associated protein
MLHRTCTNRLASVTDASGTRTVSYDGRGNTVTETRPGGLAVAASYDGHARLESYDRSNIGAQTYSYNGLGDRVRVVKPTGTRHFVYDSQGRVVAEYGASASDVKAEFIWALPPTANDNSPFGGADGIVGYAPLALVTTNTSSQLTLYWVHGNHLGVPIVTTNALGQVVDPGNDFLRPGFPGQSQVLSDLYYNRARDYDPVLGRYIQADPIGLLGDVNPYLYANSDPVNGIDPSGHFLVPLGGAVIGAGLEYLTNDCATASDIILAGAMGAIGGGFGGYLGRKGLVQGLKGLSTGRKGRIGEGLSYAKNRLLGRRPLGNHKGRIPGYRAHSDWRFQIGGRSRYIESKFGTSKLSGPQREARDGLGDYYIEERWPYEFFGDWGRRIGGAVGIAGTSAAGGECECR